jgi:hypothetical protein
MAGLYLPRIRTPEVLAAIVTGVGALLVTSLRAEATSTSVITPALVGLVVSVVTAAVVGAARTWTEQRRSGT